jgi:hypothetical protein
MAVTPPDRPQVRVTLLYIQELLAHITIGLKALLMGKNGLKRLKTGFQDKKLVLGAGFRLF